MRFPILTLLFGMLALAAGTNLASAQATRTWVSGVGDDANPCSRTAPCKTFAGAISKTAAGGEINCLDPAGYGAVTITKAMTINCEGTLGSVLVSGTNAIVVQAGTNDSVTLKGLEFEGLNSGLNGVRFISGKELHMHKFQIRNFVNNGIDIEPNNNSKVFLADGYISNVATSTGNAGVLVKANTGANESVSINRVQIEDALNGVFVDGSGGSGVMHLQLRDSVISVAGNAGIAVSSVGGAVDANVDNSLISYCVNVGAAVAGGSATLRLGRNTISDNVTGVSAANGGTLLSFKNNQFAGNLTDGTPINAVPGNSGTLQ